MPRRRIAAKVRRTVPQISLECFEYLTGKRPWEAVEDRWAVMALTSRIEPDEEEELGRLLPAAVRRKAVAITRDLTFFHTDDDGPILMRAVKPDWRKHGKDNASE